MTMVVLDDALTPILSIILLSPYLRIGIMAPFLINTGNSLSGYFLSREAPPECCSLLHKSIQSEFSGRVNFTLPPAEVIAFVNMFRPRQWLSSWKFKSFKRLPPKLWLSTDDEKRYGMRLSCRVTHSRYISVTSLPWYQGKWFEKAPFSPPFTIVAVIHPNCA